MNEVSAKFTELSVVNWSIEGKNVLIAELARPDRTDLPDWEAGAHIDIKATDRLGKDVARQYSLCSRHGEKNWRVAILGDVNGTGASLNLHEKIKNGHKLEVRGPRNLFRLQPDLDPVVLVAGGIGITPILAMAETLSSQNRNFRLHYHARSRDSAAFVEELKSSPYAASVIFSFDDESGVSVDSIFTSADAKASLYTCGPAGFMNAVIKAAKQAGVQDAKIRKELFGGSSEPVAEGSVLMDSVFTIKIHSTGALVEVPVGQTAVQALSAAGIDVLVSCEQGHCGSCLTRVLEGTPDHRDQFMLPEEHEKNDAFTPCCSRSLTPCLVLDL
jgi:vanillate O-demethylase ferredoxin subunit